MKKLLIRLLAKLIHKLRGAPIETWYFCPGHPEHYMSTVHKVYCPVCNSLLAVM
jgi:hypothetical protein